MSKLLLLGVLLFAYVMLAECTGCARKTTAGCCCKFPFVYKGKRYTGCTTKDHTHQWCKTSNGPEWGLCTGCKRRTTDGECCSFPFTYKGVKYYDCATKDHSRPWCSTGSGKWGNCWPCSTKTTDGRCCTFPFYFRGKYYRSCTTDYHSNSRLWCGTSWNVNRDFQWGHCA